MANWYDDLPDDPIEAYVFLYENLLDQEDGDEIENEKNLRIIRSFIEENEGEADLIYLKNTFGGLSLPAHKSKVSENIFHLYNKCLFRIKKNLKTEIADIVLTSEEKNKIRAHVDRIKIDIDAASISRNKHDALMRKLNAFLKEVDASRTRLGSLISASLEISSATGKAAEDLKPVTDRIKDIFDIAAKSKDLSQKWIGSEKHKLLEGPKKQLPAPENENSDKEDE
jgi:hypothetical protein